MKVVALRLLDAIAVVSLFLNGFILGDRARELIAGTLEGDYLVLRTASALFWTVVAATYLAWRGRRAS